MGRVGPIPWYIVWLVNSYWDQFEIFLAVSAVKQWKNGGYPVV